MKRRPRALCPQCGRAVAVRVPRDGDGSIYVTTKHKAAKDSTSLDCRAEIDTSQVRWP